MTDNVLLWRQIERDLERRSKQEQRRDDDATDRFFADPNNLKGIGSTATDCAGFGVRPSSEGSDNQTAQG